MKLMLVFFAIQGYALLCVGFPTSDLEVETQDEDEVMCRLTIIYIQKMVLSF